MRRRRRAASTPPLDSAPPVDTSTNTATVDNSASVDQQLVQCGARCDTPGATTVPGSRFEFGRQHRPTGAASAIQTDPSNVNIVVRVGSPGSDGTKSQASSATANAAQATEATTNGSNVDVSVAIPSMAKTLTGPSGTEPWTWSWARDLGLATNPTAAAATDTPGWNWSWTTPPAPSSTAPAPVAGQWTWTWTWTNSAGVAIDLTRTTPCACSWLWNWTWTGDPVATPPSAGDGLAPAVAAPLVTQTNSASATATATAASDVVQNVTQPAGAGDAVYASQTADSVQSAVAGASVVQSDASNANFVSSALTSPLVQENLVTGDAAATVTFNAAQTLTQARDGATDPAAHLEGAWQTITSAQTADAWAAASQSEAFNRNSVAGPPASIGPVAQSNAVRTAAVAHSSARVLQSVAQEETTGAGADQEAEAVQSSSTTQDAHASAEGMQAKVGNADDVVVPTGGSENPARTQSNEVTIVARAGNDADVTQELVQEVPAVPAPWTAVGEQSSSVVQSGDVSSSSQQAGRVNSAGWDGPARRIGVGPRRDCASRRRVDDHAVRDRVGDELVLPLAPPEPAPTLLEALRIPPLQSPVVPAGRRASAPQHALTRTGVAAGATRERHGRRRVPSGARLQPAVPSPRRHGGGARARTRARPGADGDGRRARRACRLPRVAAPVVLAGPWAAGRPRA